MPSPIAGPDSWRHRRELASVTLVLILLLIVYAQEYLRFLPNESGRIAGDYSLFLPDMLAGYYWFLHNGLLTIPWFSPAQCGGEPYFPDPQVAFYALPQMLTVLVSPLVAVQVSFIAFAAAGFMGTYGLARVSFGMTMPAAMLAATLFMFNAFYATRLLVGQSNGVLNFKNPACYTFPKQNGCVPGAPFETSAEADARALLDYRPYPFQLPAYARIANAVDGWAFLLWAGVMVGATAGAVWVRRRGPAVA